ncbi:MAG TPA: protein tyrosine phosphatase family protein [Candidatus Methylomirabilis sp.]|nr:protein tyrosine phosphatase family protein [Candidatus Methylomirabilis sp.]
MPVTDEDTLTGIYNYRRLTDRLATAGQPTEAELVAVAQAGYEVVVNLALHDAEYSLPDERKTVEALGMHYVYIPVAWARPLRSDLEHFFDVMDELSDQRVFVHCAANKRVSAFIALHRILHLGWAQDAAFAEMHAVWEPDAVWTRFLNDVLASEG